MQLGLAFRRVLTGGLDGVTGLASGAGAMGVHGPHSELIVGIWIKPLDDHGVHLDPLLD